MINQAKPTFRHRRNIDGFIDSICCDCLLTVASAEVEHQLAQYDEAHVCDPHRLHQLSADRSRGTLVSRGHDAQ
jgi:hypothetical protein